MNAARPSTFNDSRLSHEVRNDVRGARAILTWPASRPSSLPLSLSLAVVIAPGHVTRLFEQVTRQLLSGINFIPPLLDGGELAPFASPWKYPRASASTVIARQQTFHRTVGVDGCTYSPGYEQGGLTNELCAPIRRAGLTVLAYSEQSLCNDLR